MTNDPQQLGEGEYGSVPGALVPCAFEAHGGEPFIVPITQPVYSDNDPAPDTRAGEAMELLHFGLLVCLDAPARTTRTQVAALACLVSLFSNPAEAARKLGVSRSTMTRAVKAMQQALIAAQRPKHDNPQ
ncbi:MAG: winged helix-turn-helix transcriptional regulator [Verrucomicrobia bacterium]|nr:winged helix-turn-helix transcriptional regulator [Verrucomicrobiota bacterium]